MQKVCEVVSKTAYHKWDIYGILLFGKREAVHLIGGITPIHVQQSK